MVGISSHKLFQPTPPVIECDRFFNFIVVMFLYKDTHRHSTVFLSEKKVQGFQDVKFQDPKFKHEISVRIDMKHSYSSNYFVICLQSIFSVVEIIIELFVVCQNLIHVYADFLFSLYKVTKLILYVYLFIEIS